MIGQSGSSALREVRSQQGGDDEMRHLPPISFIPAHPCPEFSTSVSSWRTFGERRRLVPWRKIVGGKAATGQASVRECLVREAETKKIRCT